MGKTIPLPGDHISDGSPSVTKWVKVMFGATEGEVRYLDDTASEVQTLFTFPQYTFIEDVMWRVQTAFTGGVDLELGDTNTVNGWAEEGDIAATTAGTDIAGALYLLLVNSASSDAVTTAPTYAGIGVRCDTGATILHVSSTGTEPATGMLEVYVKYNMSQLQVSTEPDVYA